MKGRVPLAVKAYAVLAGLLPPDVRADRSEIVGTFAALREETPRGWPRTRLAVSTFGAFPWVLLVEWLEFLGARRAPGRGTHGTGRGGMGYWRDFRFALRTLRKAPSFALTSILLVTVGVGSVTAIFTLVDHVVLRPLPYPDASRLVTLNDGSFQGPLYRQLRTMKTIRHWEASWSENGNLVGEGAPLQVQEARISEGFFDLFGARAERGRLLTREDFTAPGVAVVGANAWRRIWGADPSLVGRTIQLDGKAVTVVGILADGFRPPEALMGPQVDVWIPLDWSSAILKDDGSNILEVAGRLDPGVGIPAAQTEVDAVYARMAKVTDGYRSRDGKPEHHAVLPLAQATVRDTGTGLKLILGAVALLLLVACTNVAHLFLARGLGRTREMAIRRAMGAGTRALTRQLLVESLVVGLVGGAAGSGLAWMGIRAFLAMNPDAIPRQASVTMDGRVLAFALAVSCATSLAFGLFPALRSVGGALADELRGSGRTATSGRRVGLVRNGLVAGELALSLVLVASAGLLLRSFLAVRAVDPGFDVADVWTVPLTISDAGTPDHYREIMNGILRNVEDVPGVRSAAYGMSAPLQYTGGALCCWMSHVTPPGGEADPTQQRTSVVHPVSDGYLRTLGETMVAGRSWTRGEATADPIPVVMNETLARNMYGTPEKAVGQTAGFGHRTLLVVGVTADDHHYGLDQKVRRTIFLPVERLDFVTWLADIVVKADPSASASVPSAVRKAIWAAQPDLPVPEVQSLQDAMDRSTDGRRFESLIFGIFAAVALLLAAGGLYGTLLYVAGQRRRETGIRLALGASRTRIEGVVLRSGLALGAVGVTLGLAGAWGSNRLLRSRIWGVGSGDPWALGGAAAVLLGTAVLASWLPARRAARVDPVETLKAE